MKIKTCPFCGKDPRLSDGSIEWVFSESEDDYPDNKQLVAVGCSHCGCHGSFTEFKILDVIFTGDDGIDIEVGEIVDQAEPVAHWNLRYKAKNLDKNRK